MMSTDSISSLDCANHRDIVLRVRNHFGLHEYLYILGRGIPSVCGISTVGQFIRAELIRGSISSFWIANV